jgi:type IV pilus assembly protein PilA
MYPRLSLPRGNMYRNQPPKISFLARYLLAFDRDRGFTLIELLVVIIIVGVLAAIALPNLLSQVGKAREAEGKQILASLTKAQQAYFVEKATFSNSLENLDSIVTSKHFTLPDPTIISGTAVRQQADAIDAANKNVRNFSQGVYYNTTNRTFATILCQSTTPSTAATAPNTNTGSCTTGNIVQ